MKVYSVTLTLFIDEEEWDHPDKWDWSTLLDMPFDDVILEDVKEVT